MHLVVLHFLPHLIALLDQLLQSCGILLDLEGATVDPAPHHTVVDNEAASDDRAAVTIELEVLGIVMSLIDLLSGYGEKYTFGVDREIAT